MSPRKRCSGTFLRGERRLRNAWPAARHCRLRWPRWPQALGAVPPAMAVPPLTDEGYAAEGPSAGEPWGPSPIVPSATASTAEPAASFLNCHMLILQWLQGVNGTAALDGTGRRAAHSGDRSP